MRTVYIARSNLWWHGGDPAAHELAATAYMIAGEKIGRGFLADARREIETARRMSPLSSFSWKRTAEIAELLGDGDQARWARQEADRIKEVATGRLRVPIATGRD